MEPSPVASNASSPYDCSSMRSRAAIACCLLAGCALRPAPGGGPGNETGDSAGEHRIWLVMVFVNADSGGDPHGVVQVSDIDQ